VLWDIVFSNQQLTNEWQADKLICFRTCVHRIGRRVELAAVHQVASVLMSGSIGISWRLLASGAFSSVFEQLYDRWAQKWITAWTT